LKIKRDLQGSRSFIEILLRHLQHGGSGEIAARMRSSVFKDYWPAFIIQDITGWVNRCQGGHMIPHAEDDVEESQSNLDFLVSLV